MAEADAASHGKALDVSTWTEETRERVYRSDTFVTLGNSISLQLDLGVQDEAPEGYRLPQPETTAEQEAIALHAAYCSDWGSHLTLVSKESFASLAEEWEQRHDERDAAEEQTVTQPKTLREAFKEKFETLKAGLGLHVDLDETDCSKYLPYEAERNEQFHAEEREPEADTAHLPETPQAATNEPEHDPEPVHGPDIEP